MSTAFLLCIAASMLFGIRGSLLSLAFIIANAVFHFIRKRSLRVIMPWILLAVFIISQSICIPYRLHRTFTIETALDTAPVTAPKEHTFNTEIISVYYSESFGSAYYVKLLEIDGTKAYGHATLEVGYDLEAKPYDTVICRGNGIKRQSAPYSLDSFYDRSKDICFTIEALNTSLTPARTNTLRYKIYSLRESIKELLYRSCEPEAAAFAMAVVFGVRDDVSGALSRDFSSVGITHLLAVSGSHFSALIAMLTFLLRKARLPKRKLIAPLAVFTVLFSALSGFSGAVLRAAIMALFGLLVSYLGYASDPFIALFFSAAVICAVRPYTLFDIGFLLSFFATLGLLLQLGQLELAILQKKRFLKPLIYVWESVKLTLAATLFTFPIICLCYGCVSALILPVNLIAGPVITIAMFLAIALIAVCRIPFLGELTASLFEELYRLIKNGVSAVAVNTDSSISLNTPFVIYTLLFTGCLYLFIRILGINHRLLAFAPLLMAVLTLCIGSAVYLNQSSYTDTIGIVAANGNECFILRSEGETAICDLTSGAKKAPMEAAHTASVRFYATDIDRYILTHYHPNHVNLIAKLLDSYYIKNICIPSPMTKEETDISQAIENISAPYKANVIYYSYNETVSFGNITLDIRKIPRITETHPVNFLRITAPSYDIVYYGSGMEETDKTLEMMELSLSAGTVILGSHGGKQQGLFYYYGAPISIYYPPTSSDDSLSSAVPFPTDKNGVVKEFFNPIPDNETE